MNVPVVSLCFVLACYACSVHSLPRVPLEMLTNDDGNLARATPEQGIASGMAPDEFNKMLKKLRFREIVNDNLLTPDELARIISSESNSDAHQVPPIKRREMDALMSRVQALLSDIRERQIKDTLQLPSLRFGR
ncbi:hypothetical protein ACJMK2_040083 [Sinanodonta woodiana]|uniref:Uncharacterized protein n=1 Tax=Sinanodonta woodiana TaxID=1069815 RepID=A0ABD3WEY3_SINWO